MNGLFLAILKMSLAASFVIVDVCILRLVFSRAPKWITLLLWGVVGLRLVLPVTLGDLFAATAPETNAVGIMSDEVGSGEISTDLPLDNLQTTDIGTDENNVDLFLIDNRVNNFLDSKYQESISAQSELQLFDLLSFIWLCGIIILLIYTIVRYVNLRQKICTAVPIYDNIYQSENISSSFILGIVKPKIYLPFGVGKQELDYIVSHEKAHIRRGDHIIKPLALAITVAHWFNPLVWLAFVLLSRDIELDCDERVISKLDSNSRADYTAALLKCSLPKNRAAGLLSFGEVGVKRRVRAVMLYKKPTLPLVCFALIIAAILAVCLMSYPSGRMNRLPNGDMPVIAGGDRQPSDETDDSQSNVGDDDRPQLTKASADETIARILASLTINSDNTISVSIPEILPISDDGKTELYLMLSAEFTTDGAHTIERLLDYASGWTGGEELLLPIDMTIGELSGVTLGAFYMTHIDDTSDDANASDDNVAAGNLMQIFANGSLTADPPFTYDQPLGYTQPKVEIDEVDGLTHLTYTMTDSSRVSLSLSLPEDIEFASAGDLRLDLMRSGENIGSITLYPLATTAPQDLATVDTAADSLPMQIFATVALSNHAGYDEYTVRKSTGSSAVATAQYIWQDLSEAAGDAASIPWQEQGCILAYDWNICDYFVEIKLEDEIFDQSALEALADSLILE